MKGGEKMKKILLFSLVAMALVGLIILGCSKRNTTPTVEEDTPTATSTVPAGNTATFTSTPTTTNTPGGPTATATATGAQTGLLDDCEDGDNMNKWNGAWYTYDDTSNSGGSSWIWPPAATLSMSPGGYNSSYALHVSGQVKAGYAYPFAGVGTQFSGTAGCPNCDKTNISTYTGVKFWIKGSVDATLGVHVILPYTGPCGSGSCNSLSGYNDFRYTITSSISGTWTQVTIPFSNFTTQSGWGTPPANIDIVKAAAAELQFQVKGPDSYAGPGLNFDLWIDNLELY